MTVVTIAVFAGFIVLVLYDRWWERRWWRRLRELQRRFEEEQRR